MRKEKGATIKKKVIKKREEQEEMNEEQEVRKVYTCSSCKQRATKNTGHTMLRGIRYCPKVHNITKEEWLQKMREEKGKVKRKEYTCTICKELTKNTGHTHFKGIKYCPNEPGQVSFEEWITQRHTEFLEHRPTFMDTFY